MGELVAAAELTPAATSQQLRILRHLKLVAPRRDGQAVRYQLYGDHIAALLMPRLRIGSLAPPPA